LNSELSVEVALQPIKAFDFDAAILFSDIMIPARALGFDISFQPGPVVGNPIRTASDVDQISGSPNLEELQTVFEAVRKLKASIGNRGLYGFAATPWTLACYLLDQKPFKHFERSTIWLNREEQTLRKLLDKLTELTIAYVREQVKAGADVIQLFDSWGGILPAEEYSNFSLPYANRVFEALKKENVHTLLYINGASHLSSILTGTSANGVSIDSRASISDFDSLFVGRCLQGNLDASVLFGSSVYERTTALLSSLKRDSQFVLNLGHGVLQETPWEGVQEFVRAAKEFRINL